MVRLLQVQAPCASPCFFSIHEGPKGRISVFRVPKFSHSQRNKRLKFSPRVSLTEQPLVWAGRLCVFYVLFKSGLAGHQSDAQWMPNWPKSLLPGGSKTGTLSTGDVKSMVSKWRATTKGTLKRSYRVPTKAEGQRLLKAISFLLSDDDTFKDAGSHKGCQIRRENAHAQSVCCKNVRALFDEFPTPHLVIEITPFPVDTLTESDYRKAEKIEQTLRKEPSI